MRALLTAALLLVAVAAHTDGYVDTLSILAGSSAAPENETLVPESTVTSTNNSCTTSTAHGTVDEDVDSPGTDRCTATTCGGSGTTQGLWEFDFPSPTGNLTGNQVFRTIVRQCTTGGTASTCTIEVVDGDGVECSSGAQAVSNSGSDLELSYTWTLASCTGINGIAASGAAVRLRITCPSSGGSPSSRRTADLNTVNWDATYQP